MEFFQIYNKQHSRAFQDQDQMNGAKIKGYFKLEKIPECWPFFPNNPLLDRRSHGCQKNITYFYFVGIFDIYHSNVKIIWF